MNQGDAEKVVERLADLNPHSTLQEHNETCVEAANLISTLKEENERLRSRLEMDRAWQAGPDGELVEVPAPEGMPDGIECRDETIRLLEQSVERLTRERDERGFVYAILAACAVELKENGNFNALVAFSNQFDKESAEARLAVMAERVGEQSGALKAAFSLLGIMLSSPFWKDAIGPVRGEVEEAYAQVRRALNPTEHSLGDA